MIPKMPFEIRLSWRVTKRYENLVKMNMLGACIFTVVITLLILLLLLLLTREIARAHWVIAPMSMSSFLATKYNTNKHS